MVILIIISIINTVALIYIYLKIKGLFNIKVKKEQDDSYSVTYNNQEIYNAKPK